MMNRKDLKSNDIELIDAASDAISKHFCIGRHTVGAAIRTFDGSIITGINVEAYVTRISVCAEAIAIGRAIMEGHTHFETIVAVRHPYVDNPDQKTKVCSPCGMCREMIYDYESDCKLIILDEKSLFKVSVRELLPIKYVR